jgi:hypothetical protein
MEFQRVLPGMEFASALAFATKVAQITAETPTLPVRDDPQYQRFRNGCGRRALSALADRAPIPLLDL